MKDFLRLLWVFFSINKTRGSPEPVFLTWLFIRSLHCNGSHVEIPDAREIKKNVDAMNNSARFGSIYSSDFR
jgi:hypothetical protein